MKSLQIIIINIIVLAVGLFIGWGGNYLTNTIDIDTYSVIFDLFIIIAGGGALAFLVWHITNHLPTQIKELKNKIDSNQKETKQEIKEVQQDVKGLQKTMIDLYKLLSGMNNKKDK